LASNGTPTLLTGANVSAIYVFIVHAEHRLSPTDG
jgi:hypothetical protein